MADDSGLCISSLSGAPGVLSARWAGPNRNFALAISKVEEAMSTAKSKDTTAYFNCALALAWPDMHHVVVEGKVMGNIVFPPRGEKGFGYDPIFQPDGYDISFGEMEPQEKNAMCHRAKAFKKLIPHFFNEVDKN